MKFIDLKNMVDAELKQTDTENISYSDESYKLATTNEIMNWANQSLQELAGINPEFWYKVKPFKVHSDTDTLVLPFYYQQLIRIKYGDTWYRVYSPQDETNETMFTVFDSNTIKCKHTIPKDTELYLEGYFLPTYIMDVNDTVDIPLQFIRLLVLSIVIKYAGRDNLNVGFWYKQYEDNLMLFMKSTPKVSFSSKVKLGVNL